MKAYNLKITLSKYPRGLAWPKGGPLWRHGWGLLMK
jgi:hypothetical protein